MSTITADALIFFSPPTKSSSKPSSKSATTAATQTQETEKEENSKDPNKSINLPALFCMKHISNGIGPRIPDAFHRHPDSRFLNYNSSSAPSSSSSSSFWCSTCRSSRCGCNFFPSLKEPLLGTLLTYVATSHFIPRLKIQNLNISNIFRLHLSNLRGLEIVESLASPMMLSSLLRKPLLSLDTLKLKLDNVGSQVLTLLTDVKKMPSLSRVDLSLESATGAEISKIAERFGSTSSSGKSIRLHLGARSLEAAPDLLETKLQPLANSIESLHLRFGQKAPSFAKKPDFAGLENFKKLRELEIKNFANVYFQPAPQQKQGEEEEQRDPAILASIKNHDRLQKLVIHNLFIAAERPLSFIALVEAEEEEEEQSKVELSRTEKLMQNAFIPSIISSCSYLDYLELRMISLATLRSIENLVHLRVLILTDVHLVEGNNEEQHIVKNFSQPISQLESLTTLMIDLSFCNPYSSSSSSSSPTICDAFLQPIFDPSSSCCCNQLELVHFSGGALSEKTLENIASCAASSSSPSGLSTSLKYLRIVSNDNMYRKSSWKRVLKELGEQFLIVSLSSRTVTRREFVKWFEKSEKTEEEKEKEEDDMISCGDDEKEAKDDFFTQEERLLMMRVDEYF